MQSTIPRHQILQRKKLRPKRPGEMKRKKCKPVVTHNLRDESLTKNQKAWVRSFTGSLSGWVSRRKFFKDHSKTRVQAVVEAEALSHTAEAEQQAQRSAYAAASHSQAVEGKAAFQALAQQEHAEKAAAWKHKARLMHGAGKSDMEIKGWDPVERQYIRDYELEAKIAAIKAATELELSDSNSDSSSEDDRSSTDSAANDLEMVNPDTPPQSKRQPLLISRPPPAPVLDWRDKARIGIAKKKLSITKGWGAVTWNQKSNVQERLLLLEDDGYDIQTLQGRKISSEEVTAIILERAAATQGAGTTRQAAAQNNKKPSSQSEKAPDSSPAWVDTRLMQTTQLPGQTLTPHTRERYPPPPHPKAFTPANTSNQPTQPAEASVIKDTDTTQPFSPSTIYHPLPSHRLKRKLSSFPDDDPTTSHVRKKRNIPQSTEDELAQSALQEMKSRVLRRVFRSARSILRKAAPASRVVFRSRTADELSPGAVHKEPSTLDYLHDADSGAWGEEEALVLSPRGFEEVMAELRWLASSPSSSSSSSSFVSAGLSSYLSDGHDESATISLFDPDFAPSSIPPSASAETRIVANILAQQRQRTCIAISPSPFSLDVNEVVFQGDAHILAELFKALREGRLLHRVVWEWDGERLRQGEGVDWHLGPGTQRVLGYVEGRLRGRGAATGGEIVVDVV